MNAIEISREILQELENTITQVDPAETGAVVDAVLQAKRVFVAAAGRSFLMIRGFAMRLMHMGFEAYVVGETVTPAINSEDLLVIASGSGETGTLQVIAKKAKKIGAKLAVITINPDSSIGREADYVIRIPAVSPKDAKVSGASVQPGANTFEQSVLLVGDAMVIEIIGIRDIKDENGVLMSRHANLE